jgi:hypothetical protein
VAEESPPEESDEEWVQRVEGGGRLLGGAVPVLSDPEKPDAVPPRPDVDKQPEVACELWTVPAVGEGVAVRLEDEEREHDRGPDCRPAPEKDVEDRAETLTGRHGGADHTPMEMPRYFTLEEANEALADLRPLAEQMVELRRQLVDAQARRASLGAQVGTNGGDLTPSDFAEADEQLEQAASDLAECVEQIQGTGVLVKDLDRGLLDFPARREGEDILLCWHVGEDEIRFWHGVDEGFAGRKPL